MHITHQLKEEIANALTHGIGILAGAVGGAVLITLAALYGDVWQIISAAVFVAALVLLYTASTLYHAIQHAVAKSRLKVLDHCAIFILIAGTYTPFTLVTLKGAWGWSLFGVAWGLAALGVVFKLFFTGRYEKLSTAIYIAMGWMVLVAMKPLLEALPLQNFLWLLAGGLFYTAGTYFYHKDNRLKYGHAIWHLFVLGGSVCHFVAVMLQVV
ncbi:hemolysin III family protein [Cesiribacter sp. SM1]|uniref:PAQR family membrane homeostasis protein TrhA n=1 Tax=Cesiribacter sp. SM1 TaxID=2861196 RepID=UPI001CD2A5B7|nr:hemolysin III family protein [Cesiribacter sp. SM1]